MNAAIQKWGNSQAVRIPKVVLDALGWCEDEKVTLREVENGILIEKRETKPTIEELFEGFDGTYQPEDISWGEPVGREVW